MKTQSGRLADLMNSGKVVTRAQIAKKLKVRQEMVASYLAEFVRVYKAQIEHKPRSKEYRLLKKVTVARGSKTA